MSAYRNRGVIMVGKPLGPSCGPHSRFRRDVEHLRPARKLNEHRGLGAGEEHLAAEARERVVERRTAARIEMSRDLVEERERRDSRHLGDQARMGEREADDQRLLLAGRGSRGRRLLRPMPDQKIAEMRADQRASRRGVAAAIIAQARPVAVLRLERRAVPVIASISP